MKIMFEKILYEEHKWDDMQGLESHGLLFAIRKKWTEFKIRKKECFKQAVG